MELKDVNPKFVEEDMVFTSFHKSIAEDNDPDEIKFYRYFVLRKKKYEQLKTETLSVVSLLNEFNTWRKNYINAKNDYPLTTFGNCLCKFKTNTYPMSFKERKRLSKGMVYIIDFKRLYDDLECSKLEWGGDDDDDVSYDDGDDMS